MDFNNDQFGLFNNTGTYDSIVQKQAFLGIQGQLRTTSAPFVPSAITSGFLTEKMIPGVGVYVSSDFFEARSTAQEGTKSYSVCVAGAAGSVPAINGFVVDVNAIVSNKVANTAGGMKHASSFLPEGLVGSIVSIGSGSEIYLRMTPTADDQPSALDVLLWDTTNLWITKTAVDGVTTPLTGSKLTGLVPSGRGISYSKDTTSNLFLIMKDESLAIVKL